MPTPELVKALRERTGAGIVDCMQALKATHDNLEAAITWLQEKGTIKAAKKSGAIAAEGVVNIVATKTKVVMYEVNSQTDFVATNAQFIALVDKLGQALLANDFTNIEEANAIKFEGKTLSELCLEATAVIGEKIVLRRALAIKLRPGEVIGQYVHSNKRIAALLVATGEQEEHARFVAMHVASMNPAYLNEAHVPSAKLAELKAEIANDAQLATKPQAIKENMIKGMMRKRLSELTLLEQEFVMEKMPVSKYLSEHHLVALAMHRFEVGEGIEKASVNFADEVRSQMK